MGYHRVKSRCDGNNAHVAGRADHPGTAGAIQERHRDHSEDAQIYLIQMPGPKTAVPSASSAGTWV